MVNAAAGVRYGASRGYRRGMQRSRGAACSGVDGHRRAAHRRRSPTTSTRRFEALVMAHQDRVYSIALRMLGDHARRRGGGPGRARPRLPGARRRTTPARIRELRLRGLAGDDRAQPVPVAGVGAGGCAAGQRPLDRSSAAPGLEPRRRPRRRGPAANVRRRDAARERWAAPPAPSATRLSARRRAPPRRRPELSRTRHRPRPTRGHRQGPGPPRPGAAAHGARGRRAARARGDDRMTTDRSNRVGGRDDRTCA